MPLIYSFVARSTTVLADYTAYTGNFSVVAIQVSNYYRAELRTVWCFELYGHNALIAVVLLTLQALEKGAQGSNAKFTYSCDGHSKFW